MSRAEDFEQANRAFDAFTLDERLEALEVFRGLQYPSTIDRFLEAVYQVIREHAEPEVTP